MFWFLGTLLLIASGLLAVAFVTLLERKILGLSQLRLGPQKVGVWGLLQPLLDALKLLSKEWVYLGASHQFMSWGAPQLGFWLFMALVVLQPWSAELLELKYGGLLWLCIFELLSYGVLLTGWSSSTSKYATLGAFRAAAQTISTGVSLLMVLLPGFLLLGSLNWAALSPLSPLLCFPIWSLWVVVSLGEGNRAPFDLAEGESELVSGFNLEYGSLGFVLLFLSEYGIILVLSLMSSLIMIGSLALIPFSGTLFILLGARSCYPRLRFDVLMVLMWSSVLPLGLSASFLFLLLRLSLWYRARSLGATLMR